MNVFLLIEITLMNKVYFNERTVLSLLGLELFSLCVNTTLKEIVYNSFRVFFFFFDRRDTGLPTVVLCSSRDPAAVVHRNSVTDLFLRQGRDARSRRKRIQ